MGALIEFLNLQIRVVWEICTIYSNHMHTTITRVQRKISIAQCEAMFRILCRLAMWCKLKSEAKFTKRVHTRLQNVRISGVGFASHTWQNASSEACVLFWWFRFCVYMYVPCTDTLAVYTDQKRDIASDVTCIGHLNSEITMTPLFQDKGITKDKARPSYIVDGLNWQ